MKRQQVLLLVTILMQIAQYSDALSLHEELTLTKDQKRKLFEFKDLVKSRLPHEYMQTEIYLIRWLRARDFNIKAAERFLMENIQWRKENKMDTILEEDWSDFDREYRYGIEGCDKEGRPVVSVHVGDWDVRKAVVTGQSDKMMRYFDKLYEQITTIIRRAQEHGENVTSYNLLFEMGNYNLILQGCPNCIPIYLYLFQSYQNHFPDYCNKMYLVNTPTVFQALWQLIQTVSAPQLKRLINIYGRNKTEWQNALMKDIDMRMLTSDFGGTKQAPLEIEELLDHGYFQCSRY